MTRSTIQAPSLSMKNLLSHKSISIDFSPLPLHIRQPKPHTDSPNCPPLTSKPFSSPPHSHPSHLPKNSSKPPIQNSPISNLIKKTSSKTPSPPFPLTRLFPIPVSQTNKQSQVPSRRHITVADIHGQVGRLEEQDCPSEMRLLVVHRIWDGERSKRVAHGKQIFRRLDANKWFLAPLCGHLSADYI